MSLRGLSYNGFAAFLLVLVRCSGIFGLSPVLSAAHAPMQVKAAMSLFLALTVYPIVAAGSGYTASPDIWSYVISIAGELLVGLSIGFVAALMITAVQLAGNLIDFQMGFGMANIVDPLSNTQTTVMGQLYIILATLLFIVVRADHIVIRAVVDSYEAAPLAGVGFSAGAAYHVWGLLGKVFETAFRIGGPIIAVLFLATVGLGIVARTVPQMNVLMVGFPLKIGIGLLAATAAVPFVMAVLKRVYGDLPADIMIFVRQLGG